MTFHLVNYDNGELIFGHHIPNPDYVPEAGELLTLDEDWHYEVVKAVSSKEYEQTYCYVRLLKGPS